MIKLKFFSVLFVFLMIFASVGSASATAISGNANDSHVIEVDAPTVSKIQQAIDGANDNDTILIKGSSTDTGNINCNKILTIEGENCTLNNVHWDCSNDITFKNIDFKNCKSDWGGAVYSENGSVTVSGSSFVGNYVPDSGATSGGAIYSENGSVIISGSSFINNSAVFMGGAIYSKKNVTISGSSFIDNSVDDFGGAVYSDYSVSVDGCSFVNNFANGAPVMQCEGGAVYSDGGSVKLINSNFTNNWAYDYGGAVWSDDGVTIQNCTFRNNSVTDNRGGAIYMDDSFDLRVSGSSFYGNSANDKVLFTVKVILLMSIWIHTILLRIILQKKVVLFLLMVTLALSRITGGVLQILNSIMIHC